MITHREQKRLHVFSPQPLSIFGSLSVGMLLSGAVLTAMIKLTVGRGAGPPFLVDLSMLICALVLVTGIRWTAVIGAIIFTGYLIAFYFQPFVPYHLERPKDSFSLFVIILLLIVFMFVGLGASIGACIENYVHRKQLVPGWLNAVLTGVVGVIVGAILIAAISQGTTTPAITTTTYTNGVPTIHLSIGSFQQSSVSIAKGSKLLLIDDGAYPHVLSNGTWVNGQAQPEKVTGAPALNSLAVNGERVSIGPFPIAGTFHIYCSIHPGMMLTINVQ